MPGPEEQRRLCHSAQPLCKEQSPQAFPFSSSHRYYAVPSRLINTAAYLGMSKTLGAWWLELSTELQVTGRLLVIPYKEIFTTYNKNSLHHYTL